MTMTMKISDILSRFNEYLPFKGYKLEAKDYVFYTDEELLHNPRGVDEVQPLIIFSHGLKRKKEQLDDEDGSAGNTDIANDNFKFLDNIGFLHISSPNESISRETNRVIAGLKLLHFYNGEVVKVISPSNPLRLTPSPRQPSEERQIYSRNSLDSDCFVVEMVPVEKEGSQKREPIRFTIETKDFDTKVDKTIDDYFVSCIVYTRAIRASIEIKLFHSNNLDSDVQGQVRATFRHPDSPVILSPVILFHGSTTDTKHRAVKSGETLKLDTSILTISRDLWTFKVEASLTDKTGNLAINGNVLFPFRFTFLSQLRCIHGTNGRIEIKVTWNCSCAEVQEVCCCPHGDVIGLP